MGANRKYLSDIASRNNRFDVKFNSEVINKITKKLMVEWKIFNHLSFCMFRS